MIAVETEKELNDSLLRAEGTDVNFTESCFCSIFCF